MGHKLQYHQGAERPEAKLWLLDDDGTLIDFSVGYTFEFKIGHPGHAALLTKTSGITGAAGSGSEPDGVPNVSVVWAVNDLALTPGDFGWQLKATVTGALDRYFSGDFTIDRTIA